MNKYHYEIRRKNNGEVVAICSSEAKAMGWFHRHYPTSFNTALAVGDYNLFKVDGCGKETQVTPFYF